MKFVKIMCLCKLAYVSSTPFRSGVSIDCKTQRQNIEIEALEAALEVSTIKIKLLIISLTNKIIETNGSFVENKSCMAHSSR